MPPTLLSLKKHWWLPMLLVAAAVLVVWRLTQRPDVIPPRIYGSGYSSSDMRPVEVSMYEYTDKIEWITNGRSITLRVPVAYLTFTAPLSGGAQSVIPLDFDYETGEPSTRHTAMPRRISAKLTIFGHPFSKKQAEGLLGAKSGNPHWLYKNYVYLTDTICGYDMFRDGNVHGARHTTPPPYPFDKATVFARTSSDGYDTMVECRWLGEHAWCGATRTFEGFPLRIHFDGSRLCDVDTAFARATEILNGFVVQRTAPVEGWGVK